MISIFVVAAICGNFWYESNINPGIWESLQVQEWTSLKHGYGLGQWTNTGTNTHGRLYSLHAWMTSNGYQIDDGNGQLEYIMVEGHWSKNDSYSRSFASLNDFLNTNMTDVEFLTHAWNSGWEGIHDKTWDSRVTAAKRCLQYIQEHADDPSITEWVAGNRWLSESERLNNAVMVYRYLNGETPMPPGPEPPGPEPSGKNKKEMQVWMKVRYRRF